MRRAPACKAGALGLREDRDYERTGSRHEPHEPGLREDWDCERIGTGPRK